jgi:hypothetical protein
MVLLVGTLVANLYRWLHAHDASANRPSRSLGAVVDECCGTAGQRSCHIVGCDGSDTNHSFAAASSTATSAFQIVVDYRPHHHGRGVRRCGSDHLVGADRRCHLLLSAKPSVRSRLNGSVGIIYKSLPLGIAHHLIT